MRRHLHAEWTKLRTMPGPGWLLLAIILMTVAMGAAATATASCPPMGCRHDTAKLSLMGVQVGQAFVTILAVLALSGEYSTGMIRTTLAAMPRRTTVLAAKAIMLTGLTLAAGTIAVLASILTARLTLPSNGLTPAHGYPLLSLTDGPTLRAAAGSVLYLALIALLSLGVAAAVRDSASSIGVVFGLLYVLPVLPSVISDPNWQKVLWQISPMNAGLAIQATINLPSLPLSPWTGLGVLTAWAATALLGGGLLLRLRDT
ncbi:ABC transporter permease subunit [Nonomuraea rosea]|uniref:ABC transporter permease subunit n=1 Tax=Nonomuraea rosea TaxID=638574 RepID=A0ABP7A837_9ACTN